MSRNPIFDETDELPPNGYLLTELGYLIEVEAAAGLNLATQTLIDMRKRGEAPPHTVIARRIYYGKDNLKRWLEAGGQRLTEDE